MADADSGDLLLIASGDGKAFERLLDRWMSPVYALFERIEEPSAATESAATVFESLRDGAARYSPAAPAAVFVWGLVHRALHDVPVAPAPAIPPARLRESAAARVALMRAAVAGLAPPERTAFLLTRVARVPVATTARVLGGTDADVRRTLVRALERLAVALAPLLEGPGEEPAPEDALSEEPPSETTQSEETPS